MDSENIMRWADLTAEQQCVLLNAVEQSYLFGVLSECAPGQDWEAELLPQVPRLAQIVQDFVDRGLVDLTKDSGEPGQPPVDIPVDQVHEVLSDPANWWSPEGVRPFALAPTEAGLAVYRSTRSPGRDVSQQ